MPGLTLCKNCFSEIKETDKSVYGWVHVEWKSSMCRPLTHAEPLKQDSKMLPPDFPTH